MPMLTMVFMDTDPLTMVSDPMPMLPVPMLMELMLTEPTLTPTVPSERDLLTPNLRLMPTTALMDMLLLTVTDMLQDLTPMLPIAMDTELTDTDGKIRLKIKFKTNRLAYDYIVPSL